MVHTDRAPTDRVHTDRAQTNRVQTDRVQMTRPSSDSLGPESLISYIQFFGAFRGEFWMVLTCFSRSVRSILRSEYRSKILITSVQNILRV